MSRPLIASATKDEPGVQTCSITKRTLDDAARNVSPEDADAMTSREELVVQLCPRLCHSGGTEKEASFAFMK